jgi:E3 ubiquitin-protein ligase makorin
MASSTTVNPTEQPRELCRYFLSNVCRYGDNCIYSHDRSNGQVNNVCRYYLQGKCSFGERCRYDHVRPKPQTSMSFQPVSLPFYPPLPQNFVHPKTQPINGEIPMSYASVCRGTNDMMDPSIMINQISLSSPALLLQSLCPYAEKEGICEALETGRYCPYIHGDLCDLCEMPALHPTNEKQREEHRLECLRKHEADCEEAFATQRSQNKKCGVCLETVWDRDGDKRFGILENCDHIFCLECIRKWRASSNYDNKVVKACPECRTKSDFVTPTKYWPENEQAKHELIKAYKENLQQIHCKFFKRGEGLCPFGSKCFYLHVDKNGHTVELGPPRRRQRINARGELENFSDVFMLSVFSNEDYGRFFDEYDFLFDDEDDESHHSDLTDEEELRFVDENNLSDNDDENSSTPVWH